MQAEVEPSRQRTEITAALTAGFDPVTPLIGVGLLLLFGWLYLRHEALYQAILRLWMLQPLPAPFMDLEFITSGVECWARGVDVYEHDPCDRYDREHIYSPLWLRFVFLPIGHQWTNVLGLGLLVCFLVALGFVPRPRGRAGLLLWLLGVFSYAGIFGYERGNMDLLMFVWFVIAGFLLGGALPRRLGGYGLFLLAALLKFYPAVLFALLLRERWRALFAIGAVIAAVFAGFVAWFHDELPRMAAHLPVTWPPGNGWGVKGLARGLNDILPELFTWLGYRAPWVDALPDTHLAAFVILVLLLLVSLVTALHLAHRRDIIAALDLLPPRAACFLLIGAALVCGCFYLGQSLAYRAVFMLLALPAFIALSRSAPVSGVRRLLGWTVALMLYVMWQYPLRWWVPELFGGTFDPPEGLVFLPAPGWIATYIAWGLTELAWWWVITMLMMVLLWFLGTLQRAPAR